MYIGRLPAEVVQRVHARNDRRKRRGNLRIARVRPVLFTLDNVAVNGGVESLLHLSGVAGKVDHRAAV